MCVHVCVYMHVCTCVCACVCVCVHACVCACVQMFLITLTTFNSQAVSLLEEALEKYADFPKVCNLIAQPITTLLSTHVSQYISVHLCTSQYISVYLCTSQYILVYLYICSDVQLWMMRGQIEEQQGNTAAAREFYSKAVSSHDYEEWIMESENGEHEVTKKAPKILSFVPCSQPSSFLLFSLHSQ